MKQQEFVRSLSAEQRTALTQKSDAIGFQHLAVHWGLIALLAVCISLKPDYWPVLMLPQGILIVFCFTLMHETTHRTAFANGKVNEIVGRVCGLMIVIPNEWFRCFHFDHHRYTQDPENDPELSAAKPSSIWQYVKHISGLPVWFSQFRTLISNARGFCKDRYVPDAKLPRIRAEARGMCLFYLFLFVASLALKSDVLLYIWIFPALLGQPFLRFYLLAEHGRCAFVSNIYDNTRTTISHALVRRLAWQMPFHTEHHAYPAVPFHRLADLHELMKKNINHFDKGYISFNTKYVQQLLQK